MKFGSVCSGIEAASVAWGPLGWRAAWLSEIEPFPCAVLAHHYPDVPNLGDMTTLAARIRAGDVEAPDVFCGGTPCQAFSVAGLRRSLDDARGNLSLTFCEIANELDSTRAAAGKPEVVVFWENVPGVLSTADNAFGCFLAGLSGAGDALVPEPRPAAGKSSRFWRWNKATGDHTPKWPSAGAVLGPQRAVAWRVMDAQYTGVAQRRRRVFVVASAREGFDPAAVLFEFDGVRRDTAPSREQGQRVTPPIAGCSNHGGANGPSRTADDAEALVFDTTQVTSAENRCNPQPGHPCHPLAAGAHAPAIAYGFQPRIARNGRGDMGDVINALAAQSGETGKGDAAPCVAYTTKLHNTASNNAGKIFEERTTALDACSPPPALLTAMQVRRLTPTECERLQDFPDGYTAIPWRTWQEAARKGASYEGLLAERGMTLRGPSVEECPDGPRYKALGNSWAVSNVRIIGRRIDAALRALEHANDNDQQEGRAVA